MSHSLLRNAAAGTLLAVRALPGSRREGIVGLHGDALKVATQQPAEGGRANEAIRALLAQALSLPRRDVELRSGSSGRDKILLLRGLSPDDARRRLAPHLPPGALP